MNCSMAWVAEGDKVLFNVGPELSSCLKMMNLQLSARPTELATPSIPFQHASMDVLVLGPVKAITIHAASWAVSRCSKAFC